MAEPNITTCRNATARERARTVPNATFVTEAEPFLLKSAIPNRNSRSGDLVPYRYSASHKLEDTVVGLSRDAKKWLRGEKKGKKQGQRKSDRATAKESIGRLQTMNKYIRGVSTPMGD
jgi:hypothetical protein